MGKQGPQTLEAPTVCRIIAVLRVLGHNFTTFGGLGKQGPKTLKVSK